MEELKNQPGTNLETVSEEIKNAIANNDRDAIKDAISSGELSFAEYEQLKNPKAEEKEETKEIEETISEEKTDLPVNPENETKKTEEIVKDDAEKLKRQVEEKENFIKRQANEIGELRKKAKEFEEWQKSQKKPEMSEEDWARYNENPKAFLLEESKKEAEAQKQKESEFKEEERIFLEIFSNKVKTGFKESMPEMVKILKEDGLPTEVIEKFQENPYENGGNFLIQLGLRAAERKKFNLEVKKNEETAKTFAEKTNAKKPAITSKATNSNFEGSFKSIESVFKSGGIEAVTEMIDRGEITTAEAKTWRAQRG